MPDIRQLPPSVINKIAAGEVIERPASVVKELLENSVDAGARRIDVAVEQGGTSLVRISDNGCGIKPEQLRLAVASHATSKINDADDLFQVKTLGFRGEALASIAEISHTRLRSRTPESDAGAEVEINGGLLGEIAPCGCPVGTTIEVRDLFFNTPVRRKFLRAGQTEMGHTSEAFTRIALAYPQVHFTLRHNERTLYDLPPVENWRERIVSFFGSELGDVLIPVEGTEGNVRLSGFAANPTYSRGNNRMQYLFLCGRYIRDRSLQHALGEAYRGLLMTGRFPVVFLRLEMPPDDVDVNVHPTKLEVRFLDSGRVYSQILGTLRRRFLTTDLTAKVHSPDTATTEQVPPAIAPAGDDFVESHRQQMVAWARGEAEAPPAVAPQGAPQQSRLDLHASPAGAPMPSGLAARIAGFGKTPEFKPFPNAGPTPVRRFEPSAFADDPFGAPRAQPPAPANAAYSSVAVVSRAEPAAQNRSGLQLHNRYLVTENEDGIVIIDQHALHERILYEQLRDRTMSGTIEKQRLLVPEPVQLSPAEAAAVLDARETLGQLGIEVEPFGGDTVVITGYPAMLANLGPAEILRQVVEQLVDGRKTPDRRELLDELLHMIACKAAVKAGDHLSPEEVTVLLEHRELCQDAHHCPHGRPTALVFTKTELDKRFKRT